MRGLVKTNPAITARITMSAAITIFNGTSAFVLGRRRVVGPANEMGKLMVSLKMKLNATPAIRVEMRCAGR